MTRNAATKHQEKRSPLHVRTAYHDAADLNVRVDLLVDHFLVARRAREVVGRIARRERPLLEVADVAHREDDVRLGEHAQAGKAEGQVPGDGVREEGQVLGLLGLGQRWIPLVD